MQRGDDAQQRYGGTEEVVVNATSFTAVNPFEPALNVKFLCAAQTQCVARQAKPQRLLIWTVFSSTLTLLREALAMACDDSEWGRQANRRAEVWVR